MIFEIKNFSFTYRGRPTPTLKNVNLEIRRGDFVAVTGESGSGKSTLLRMLQPFGSERGIGKGEILYKGVPVDRVDPLTFAAETSLILQDAAISNVAERVGDELALGLKRFGATDEEIELRLAEVCAFLGISDLIDARFSALSGGRKRLVNLAAALTSGPEVIILDEPFLELDPVTADAFSSVLEKLNRTFSITIITSSSSLERTLRLADKICSLDGRGGVKFETVSRFVGSVKPGNENDFLALPAELKIYKILGGGSDFPKSLKEARVWFDGLFSGVGRIKDSTEPPEKASPAGRVLEIRDIWFKYERSSGDVLKNLNLTLERGKITAIAGVNGCGKSTLLKCIAGILSPYRGKISFPSSRRARPWHGKRSGIKIATIPQDCAFPSVEDTGRELFTKALGRDSLNNEDVERIINKFKLEPILDVPINALCAGAKRLLRSSVVAAGRPDLMLLDEPTVGLDPGRKLLLTESLREAADRGAGILIASHDLEFCSETADIMHTMLNGSLSPPADKNEFFSVSRFYSTAPRLLTVNVFKNAVTVKDVINLCEENGVP